MKDWEELEWSLLFKELVIMKDDTEENSESSNEIALSREQSSAKQEQEEEQIAEDSSTSTALKLAILCPSAEIAILNATDSKLRKISTALGISPIHEQLQSVEELDIEQSIGSETVVWAIGLSPDQQTQIKSKTHAACLFSANPEYLASVDEKRQMFEPLKQFKDYLI